MIPLKDSDPSHIFPFWTYTIIAINIYVFYLQLTSPNPDSFIAQYALIPANVDFSNLSTLTPFITSQFLHGGFLHILSNMWFLFIFGDNVEERAGFFFFPIFYLMSGVVGAFAQYYFTPDATIPMIGASGAIAGVLGAYFSWFRTHTIKSLVPIFGFFTILDIPAYFMLFYWLATQVIAGVGTFSSAGDMGGIAYFAHIGGFLTGWMLTRVAPIKVTETTY